MGQVRLGSLRAFGKELARRGTLKSWTCREVLEQHVSTRRSGGIRLISRPKGPFRTKNTTTIVKIVNYYAVVFLLRPPPKFTTPWRGKNVSISQENGVRNKVGRDSKSPRRTKNTTRSKFTTRSTLSTAGGGPLGPPKNTEFGPRKPCVRCAAVRIVRLAFVGAYSFYVELRNGPRELSAFAEY